MGYFVPELPEDVLADLRDCTSLDLIDSISIADEKKPWIQHEYSIHFIDYSEISSLAQLAIESENFIKNAMGGFFYYEYEGVYELEDLEEQDNY